MMSRSEPAVDAMKRTLVAASWCLARCVIRSVSHQVGNMGLVTSEAPMRLRPVCGSCE